MAVSFRRPVARQAVVVRAKKDAKEPEQPESVEEQAMQKVVREISKDRTESPERRALAKKLIRRRRRKACFITGVHYGFRMPHVFGMNRHFMRKMSYEGLLPGVRKYMW